jgi:hypothetical protein
MFFISTAFELAAALDAGEAAALDAPGAELEEPPHAAIMSAMTLTKMGILDVRMVTFLPGTGVPR